MEGWAPGTLLSRMSPAREREVRELGTLRSYTSGDRILREGDTTSHVVLLVAGLVKVTASTPGGRGALLAIRIAGDLVGEMSALNSHPRTASVTACGPVTARLIGRAELVAYLGRHADVSVQLLGSVIDRLRSANRRRIDFTSFTAGIRVARILAELATFYGRQTTAGVEIGFPLTQQELATLTGATDPTVQRALRSLRNAKLIDTGYRRIIVRDLPALRDAGECTGEDW